MKKAKLPAQFKNNLMQIAEGLNGRPINADFAEEWNIKPNDAMLLLEYLHKAGVVDITWFPEQQQMCFTRKI